MSILSTVAKKSQILTALVMTALVNFKKKSCLIRTQTNILNFLPLYLAAVADSMLYVWIQVQVRISLLKYYIYLWFYVLPFDLLMIIYYTLKAFHFP